ncbi:MAG TPA: taurine ABC transporter substrate-binding protein [Lautropia sp.]|nr:taurine ABC transporter substrate-binding protein [Lautropia sp.]
MNRRCSTRLIAMAAIAAGALPWLGSAAAQTKEVTIAHQDMMVPWRYAHATKEVEKATGYKVNYRKFGGGGDVIRAMASGQVHIGEAGSAPIAAALSQGLPVQLVWILDDIGAAEVLVARNGSGIEKLADLKGKKIGVPFTSTTHFHTMVALEAAKIDPASVRILNLRPPEVAAAWERGDIDATFIWEPVLSRVLANGKPLITSGEIAKQTGKATFDGVVVNTDWAKTNGNFVTQFIKVMAAADADYRANKEKWAANSPQVKAIAEISGAKVEDVPAGLSLYGFPSLQEQASKTWLGGGKDGGAARSLAETSAFLKSQGTIQQVLPDYSVGVNPTYVEAAAK